MPRVNIEGIKKPFAELYPETEALRCVELMIPDDDGYLWILAGFVAILGKSWAWRGEPSARFLRAEMWQKAYAETDWNQCMNCEQLIECLQPLFDAINLRFDNLDTAVSALQTVTDAIQTVQEASAAQPLELPQETVASSICGGAYALVRQMDTTNRLLYQEAEDSFVDNAAEWISMILDIFPAFAAQGVNAGAELANALASNNVASYEAAYLTFEDIAVGSLKCWIEANDGVLTYDVWGDWLDELPSLFSPSNYAAELYAKYSPLRQTFINQLAELINQEQSLQNYFDDLWNVYYTGTTNPLTCPVYDCPMSEPIPANVDLPGTDTGFAVTMGTEYRINCAGVWQGGTAIDYDARGNIGVTNPSALVPAANIYSMLYRIGTSGAWTYVGLELIFTAAGSGNLYFIMNDITGAYGDNSGEITVTMRAT